MPDTFDSMAVDIATLIPGLDEAIGGSDAVTGDDSAEQFLDEIVDEIVDGGDDGGADEGDEAEENISEESTQDSNDVDNEVKPNEAPDALGRALAQLSALESEKQSLQRDLETAQVQLSKPVFIPYDELPENVQAMFDADAAKDGVDPRMLVRMHFNEIVREYESKARALTFQREDGAKAAVAFVDKFFDEHPLKAKHGKEIAKLVADMGWERLQPLAQQNPEIFKSTAVALVDAAFRKAEADDVLRQRALKQQKTLKESTRSEASRARPTATPTKKPDQGEINAQSMADFMKANSNPLESLFR